MNRVSLILMILVLTSLLSSFPFHKAQADRSTDLVTHATEVLIDMLEDPDFAFMHSMISQARAIVIVPQLIKGGFIIGAEGGSAILLAQETKGQWSYPAFLTLISGSIGFQIGGQVSQLILIVRNEEALKQLLADGVKLGADLSVALGPVGVSTKGGTTTNFKTDLIAFAKSQGLFGGGALEGGILTSNNSRNKEFYGQPLTNQQILYQQRGRNPNAELLRHYLTTFEHD